MRRAFSQSDWCMYSRPSAISVGKTRVDAVGRVACSSAFQQLASLSAIEAKRKWIARQILAGDRPFRRCARRATSYTAAALRPSATGVVVDSASGSGDLNVMSGANFVRICL